MATPTRCALLLTSIHQVMKAEDTLRRAALFCDLVPVPREISSECGMAVLIECDDVERVTGMLEAADLRIQALFRVVDGGFITVFDGRERHERRDA